MKGFGVRRLGAALDWVNLFGSGYLPETRAVIRRWAGR